jgi:hypothetical protein
MRKETYSGKLLSHWASLLVDESLVNAVNLTIEWVRAAGSKSTRG